MTAVKRIIALVALLAAFAAPAIEPPKTVPAPASTPAKESPAKPDARPAAPADDAAPAEKPAGDAAKPDATAPADADEEELPPLPPDAVPAGPPPQRFNPTEKVRADFPVSFPIDI
jgi:hypothetical protein